MSFHRRSFSCARVLAGVCAMGAVAACSAPKMAVPADIAPATEEVPVSGRSQASGLAVNEGFKLGPYDVADVARGAKSKSSFSAFGSFKSNEEAGYSFAFKQGGQSVHGECKSEASESGFHLGSTSVGGSKTKLGCACGAGNGPDASLVIAASDGDGYGGELKAHDASFQVKAIYDRQGGLSDGNPSGYRIDGKDGVVGAVDVLGGGRVWLSKSLDAQQREDVSCIVAGLLLYKPTMKH